MDYSGWWFHDSVAIAIVHDIANVISATECILKMIKMASVTCVQVYVYTDIHIHIQSWSQKI